MQELAPVTGSGRDPELPNPRGLTKMRFTREEPRACACKLKVC